MKRRVDLFDMKMRAFFSNEVGDKKRVAACGLMTYYVKVA